MTHGILVSDTKTADPTVIADALDGIDAEIETIVAHEPASVVEHARGADALIVDATTPVTGDVLAELDALDVVGRAGIGVDNVAVEAARERDVRVVNVPDYCIEEVSTHAFALALACVRRLGQFDRSVKAGSWDWTVGQPISRLAGSTVGLFAFGKIARRFAAKLRGFDVEVVAHDPYVRDYRMADFGVESVGLDELLARSDLLSIHAPLTEETRGTFDDGAFDRMGEGTILINTARGPIVDEDALLAALDDGTIDSAGLDVRGTEPPRGSPLHDRDDVLLTPHVAWYSQESRTDLSASVARDVARVLRGEEPRNPVGSDANWG